MKTKQAARKAARPRQVRLLRSGSPARRPRQLCEGFCALLSAAPRSSPPELQPPTALSYDSNLPSCSIPDPVTFILVHAVVDMRRAHPWRRCQESHLFRMMLHRQFPLRFADSSRLSNVPKPTVQRAPAVPTPPTSRPVAVFSFASIKS